MSEALMYIPRRYANREHEEITQRIVTKICRKMGLSWESIPKLFVCPSCRRPLLAITHALALKADSKMLQELLSMRILYLSRKAKFKYIAAIFMPPYIYYFVVGGDRENIALANEFYKKTIPRLLGKRCLSCGTEFNHYLRKLYKEFKDRILVKEEIEALQFQGVDIIVDSVTSENLFREIGNESYSACDIDFVLFRNVSPVGVIEAVAWKQNYGFKATTISEKFAETIGVPFFLLKVISDGSDMRIIVETKEKRVEGDLEMVVSFLRSELREQIPQNY